MNGLKDYINRLEKMPFIDDEYGSSPYDKLQYLKAGKISDFRKDIIVWKLLEKFWTITKTRNL
jgi:hypothetical protein